MNSAFFVSRRPPSKYAMDIREEFGYSDHQAIDLYQVCEDLGIRVRVEALSRGLLGACKVVGLKKLIVISNCITYQNQRRFTIAHEIGHAIIHNGVHCCNADDLKMWVSKQTKEREANQFAAELLLPGTIVTQKIRGQDISLGLAQELSDCYGISLTSCLLRLLEIGDENVSVFYQKGDSIQWSYRSQDCTAKPISGKVDIDSLSYHTSEKRSKRQDYVDCSCWFQVPESGDLRCYEETWFFPSSNTKLTIARIENN